MNRIININLGGRLIPIDENAYEALNLYINKLKRYFAQEQDGDEIVRDMEDRIGELFQDKLKRNKACIMQSDIDEMIGIMGSPEQIETETQEEPHSHSQNTQNSNDQAQQQHTYFDSNKRLSRNTFDQKIGGVCSGLAQYFNIDVTVVRVAMILFTIAWGSGILLYLLLWIVLPENNAPNQSTLKRRLYRNPEQKVIAGVCSGIANYLNIDVIIPRIIFVAPLLGVIFFAIFNNNSFVFPVFTGGLPTMVLLYLVLWIALPQPKSLTEKMEMRGEKIDVQNLSQAAKRNSYDVKKKSSISGFLGVIGKIILFGFLGIIVFALSMVIIALGASLVGWSTNNQQLYTLINVVIPNSTESIGIIIAISFLLLIPTVIFIRLLIRLISNKPKRSYKWFNLLLIILFFASIFYLFWAGSNIARNFNKHYSKTHELPIQQPNSDTLIIKQMLLNEGHAIGEKDWNMVAINRWNKNNEVDFFEITEDNRVHIANVNLKFSPSNDSLFHVYIQKNASGISYTVAEQRAEAIAYNFQQQNNILTLARNFVLAPKEPFRNQKINIDVQIPVGKVFITKDIGKDFFTRRVFNFKTSNISYNEIWNDGWDNDVYYKMTKHGIDSTYTQNTMDTE